MRKLKRRTKIVLFVFGFILLGGLVLLGLTPMIASGIVRSKLTLAIGAQINGSVDVGSVGLSWFGPIAVEHVVVTEADGTRVLDASVKLEPGLVSLARGWLAKDIDLGTVEVHGDATMTYHADGTSSIDRLQKQAAPPNARSQPTSPSTLSTSPISLPTGIEGVIDLTGLALHVVRSDGSGSQHTASATLVGTITLGSPDVVVDLDATFVGTDVRDGGSVAIDATLASLMPTSRSIDLFNASINTTIALKDISSVWADLLAGTHGLVAAATGDRVRGTVRYAGSTTNGAGSVSVDSPLAKFEASLSRTADLFAIAGPATASVGLRDLVAWVEKTSGKPLIDPALAELVSLPGGSLTINSFAVPMDGNSPQIAGAVFDMTASLDAFAMKMKGEGVRAGTYAIAPFAMRIHSPKLADGAAVTGGTSVQKDSVSAGTLTIDIQALRVVDESGSFNSALDMMVSGDISLAGLDTAVLDPFLVPHGLSAPRDIGPMVSMKLSAQSPRAGTPTPITASIASDNIAGELRAQIQGLASQSQDAPIVAELADGSRLRIKQLGPALKAMLGKSGLEVTSASSVDVAASASNIALTTGVDGTRSLSLKETKADVRVSLGQIAGTMRLAPAGVVGASASAQSPAPAVLPMPFVVQPTTLTMQTARLSDGVEVSLQSALAMRNAPAGPIHATLGITSVLDPLGAIAPLSDARINGLVSIDRLAIDMVRNHMADPFMVDVVRGYGDRVSATITLSSIDADAGALGLPPVRIGIESVGLMGGSRRGTLTGALEVASSTISVKEPGIVLSNYVPIPEMTAKIASMSSDSFVVSRAGSYEVRIPTLTVSTENLSVDAIVTSARLRAQLRPAGLAIAASSVPGAQPSSFSLQSGTFDMQVADGVVTTSSDLAMQVIAAGGSRVETVGLRGAHINATMPLAAVFDSSSQRATLSLDADIIHGSAQSSSGKLHVESFVSLQQSKSVGPFEMSVALRDVPSALADGLLQVVNPESTMRASDAFGPKVGMDVDISGLFELVPPAESDGPVQPGALVPSPTRINSAISIASEHLNTVRPISVAINQATIEAQPFDVVWSVSPAMASSFIPASSGFALEKASRIQLGVRSMRVARPRAQVQSVPGVGLFKPDVFLLGMTVSSPELQLRAQRVPTETNPTMKPGPASVLRVNDFTLDAFTTLAGQIEFRGSALIDGKPANVDGMKGIGLWGQVLDYRDPTGSMTAAKAKLTSDIILRNVPTVFVDAMIGRENFASEALGPAAFVTIKVRNANADSGTVTADLGSARAQGTLAGEIHNGVFETTEPVVLTLKEISPSFSQSLFRGVPIVGGITKSAGEEPALLRISDVRYPLDGDLHKLSAMLFFDPGTAQVQSSESLLGRLLLPELRSGPKTVGRKLDAMTVTIKNGIATYPKYTIPLGEFSVSSSGSVNMADRTLDLVTYLPLGALATESLGSVGGDVSRLMLSLDEITPLPFRIRGGFTGASVSLDEERLLKEVGQQLLRPDQIIEKGLDGVFKDLFGGGG